MQALIQRASRASVSVAGDVVGRIDRGLVVLVAVLKGDDEAKARRMAQRLLGYRVFPAARGADSDSAPGPSDRMEKSVVDINGELLLIPQFTLGADVRKGTRASFHPLADPETAERLFESLCGLLEPESKIARGVFGAHMQVELVNDGPVTFLLQS